MEQTTEQKSAFNRGENVPAEGNYVCVPCGYHHHFKPGEKFSECLSCMSGTAEGHEEFVEGLEMWEKEQQNPPEVTGDATTGV